jgi:hypothetical protein
MLIAATLTDQLHFIQLLAAMTWVGVPSRSVG